MLTIAATANAYNILVLVPTIAKTNWDSMQMFIDELLFKRGHHVTCITSYAADKHIRTHANYTEAIIKPMFQVESEFMRKY